MEPIKLVNFLQALDKAGYLKKGNLQQILSNQELFNKTYSFFTDPNMRKNFDAMLYKTTGINANDYIKLDEYDLAVRPIYEKFVNSTEKQNLDFDSLYDEVYKSNMSGESEEAVKSALRERFNTLLTPYYSTLNKLNKTILKVQRSLNSKTFVDEAMELGAISYLNNFWGTEGNTDDYQHLSQADVHRAFNVYNLLTNNKDKFKLDNLEKGYKKVESLGAWTHDILSTLVTSAAIWGETALFQGLNLFIKVPQAAIKGLQIAKNWKTLPKAIWNTTKYGLKRGAIGEATGQVFNLMSDYDAKRDSEILKDFIDIGENEEYDLQIKDKKVYEKYKSFLPEEQSDFKYAFNEAYNGALDAVESAFELITESLFPEMKFGNTFPKRLLYNATIGSALEATTEDVSNIIGDLRHDTNSSLILDVIKSSLGKEVDYTEGINAFALAALTGHLLGAGTSALDMTARAIASPYYNKLLKEVVNPAYFDRHFNLLNRIEKGEKITNKDRTYIFIKNLSEPEITQKIDKNIMSLDPESLKQVKEIRDRIEQQVKSTNTEIKDPQLLDRLAYMQFIRDGLDFTKNGKTIGVIDNLIEHYKIYKEDIEQKLKEKTKETNQESTEQETTQENTEQKTNKEITEQDLFELLKKYNKEVVEETPQESFDEIDKQLKEKIYLSLSTIAKEQENKNTIYKGLLDIFNDKGKLVNDVISEKFYDDVYYAYEPLGRSKKDFLAYQLINDEIIDKNGVPHTLKNKLDKKTKDKIAALLIAKGYELEDYEFSTDTEKESENNPNEPKNNVSPNEGKTKVDDSEISNDEEIKKQHEEIEKAYEETEKDFLKMDELNKGEKTNIDDTTEIVPIEEVQQSDEKGKDIIEEKTKNKEKTDNEEVPKEINKSEELPKEIESKDNKQESESTPQEYSKEPSTEETNIPNEPKTEDNRSLIEREFNRIFGDEEVAILNVIKDNKKLIMVRKIYGDYIEYTIGNDILEKDELSNYKPAYEIEKNYEGEYTLEEFLKTYKISPKSKIGALIISSLNKNINIVFVNDIDKDVKNENIKENLKKALKTKIITGVYKDNKIYLIMPIIRIAAMNRALNTNELFENTFEHETVHAVFDQLLKIDKEFYENVNKIRIKTIKAINEKVKNEKNKKILFSQIDSENEFNANKEFLAHILSQSVKFLSPIKVVKIMKSTYYDKKLTLFDKIKVVFKDTFDKNFPNSLYDELEQLITKTIDNKIKRVYEQNSESDIKSSEEYVNKQKNNESYMSLSIEEPKILGIADLNAYKILIDAVNQRQDTLPHEYAHFYIRWFIDTPIVQEGIKRFGSEEALVQAIGEQVVRQKGEAYRWWNKFVNWILKILSDKQILQILTDSFLNRVNLNDFTKINNKVRKDTGINIDLFPDMTSNTSTYDKNLGDIIYDRIKKKYPEINVIFSDTPLIYDGNTLILLQLSEKLREEFLNSLRKNRKDLVEKGLIESSLNEIEKFVDTYFKDKQYSIQKLVSKVLVKWLANSNIILPEDNERVLTAINIGLANNVDLLTIKNPNELFDLEKYELPKKLLSPDEMPTFKNKRDIGENITVYDVDNTREGMMDVRKIQDNHLGEKNNAWCTTARYNNSLEKAYHNWSKVYPSNKMVAFQNGKLIAFGTVENGWADKQDEMGKGIPIVVRLNDNTGRKQIVRVKDTDASVVLSKGLIFKGSKTNGIYEEWYDENHLSLRTHYKDNKKHGLHEQWHKNGNIGYKVMYEDGKIIGTSQSWYDNGELKTKIEHKNGVRDGLFEGWYKSGKLRESYTYEDGLLDGVGIEWYPNGRIQSKVNYIKNQKNGLYQEWYENGVLKSKVMYRNDLIHGLYENYHLNGQIARRIEYSYDKKNGLEEAWFNNGQISYRAIFKNGEMNGLLERWYPDGQIKEKTMYKNDLPNGLSEMWDENGKLIMRGEYKNGNPVGLHQRWSADGETTKFNYGYKADNQIKDFNEDDSYMALSPKNYDEKFNEDLENYNKYKEEFKNEISSKDIILRKIEKYRRTFNTVVPKVKELENGKSIVYVDKPVYRKATELKWFKESEKVNNDKRYGYRLLDRMDDLEASNMIISINAIENLHIDDRRFWFDKITTYLVALDMEARGANPKQIYYATRWIKNPIGKWVYSTNKILKLKSSVKEKFPEKINIERLITQDRKISIKLLDLVEKSNIFTLYPLLKNTKVTFGELLYNTDAEYDNVTNTITINKYGYYDIEPFEGIISHEVQHAIQFIEGYYDSIMYLATHNLVYTVMEGEGIYNSQYLRELNITQRAYKDILLQNFKDYIYSMYRNLLTEKEAFAVGLVKNRPLNLYVLYSKNVITNINDLKRLTRNYANDLIEKALGESEESSSFMNLGDINNFLYGFGDSGKVEHTKIDVKEIITSDLKTTTREGVSSRAEIAILLGNLFNKKVPEDYIAFIKSFHYNEFMRIKEFANEKNEKGEFTERALKLREYFKEEKQRRKVKLELNEFIERYLEHQYQEINKLKKKKTFFIIQSGYKNNRVYNIEENNGIVYYGHKNLPMSSYQPKRAVERYTKQIADFLGLNEEDIEIVYFEGFKDENGNVNTLDKSDESYEYITKFLYHNGMIFLNIFAEKSIIPVVKFPLAKLDKDKVGKTIEVLKDVYKVKLNNTSDALPVNITLFLSAVLQDLKYSDTIDGLVKRFYNILNGLTKLVVNNTLRPLNKVMKRATLVADLDYSASNDFKPVDIILEEKNKLAKYGYNIEIKPADYDEFPFFFTKINDESVFVQRVLFVDDETFGRINRFSSKTMFDGQSFSLSGRNGFNTLYRILKGHTQFGSLKNWYSGSVYIDGKATDEKIYIKHSINELDSNFDKIEDKDFEQSIAKIMKENNISLIIPLSNEKFDAIKERFDKDDISSKIVTKKDLMVGELNIKNKVVLLPVILNWNTNRETGKERIKTKGLKQLLYTKTFIKENIFIKNSEIFDKINNIIKDSAQRLMKKLSIYRNDDEKLLEVIKAMKDSKYEKFKVINRVLEPFKDNPKILKNILKIPYFSEIFNSYILEMINDSISYNISGDTLILASSLNYHLRPEILIATIDDYLLNEITEKEKLEIFSNENDLNRENTAYINYQAYKKSREYKNKIQRLEVKLKNSEEYTDEEIKQINEEIEVLRKEETNIRKYNVNKNKAYGVIKEKLKEKYFDKDGYLKENYAIIPSSYKINQGIEVGESLLAVITPMADATQYLPLKVVGIINDNTQTSHNTLLVNPKYVQAFGRDYDIDVLNVVTRYGLNLSSLDWESFIQDLLNIQIEYVNEVFKYYSDQIRLNVKVDEKLSKFDQMLEKLYIMQNDNYNITFMQSIFGQASDILNEELISNDALKLSEKYKKEIGIIVTEQMYYTLLAGTGIKIEGKTVLGESEDDMKKMLLMFQILTNHSVDVPNNTSIFRYNFTPKALKRKIYDNFGIGQNSRKVEVYDTILNTIFKPFISILRLEDIENYDVNEFLRDLNRAKNIIQYIKDYNDAIKKNLPLTINDFAKYILLLGSSNKELSPDEENKRIDITVAWLKNIRFEHFTDHPLIKFIDELDFDEVLNKFYRMKLDQYVDIFSSPLFYELSNIDKAGSESRRRIVLNELVGLIFGYNEKMNAYVSTNNYTEVSVIKFSIYNKLNELLNRKNYNNGIVYKLLLPIIFDKKIIPTNAIAETFWYYGNNLNGVTKSALIVKNGNFAFNKLIIYINKNKNLTIAYRINSPEGKIVELTVDKLKDTIIENKNGEKVTLLELITDAMFDENKLTEEEKKELKEGFFYGNNSYKDILIETLRKKGEVQDDIQQYEIDGKSYDDLVNKFLDMNIGFINRFFFSIKFNINSKVWVPYDIRYQLAKKVIDKEVPQVGRIILPKNLNIDSESPDQLFYTLNKEEGDIESSFLNSYSGIVGKKIKEYKDELTPKQSEYVDSIGHIVQLLILQEDALKKEGYEVNDVEKYIAEVSNKIETPSIDFFNGLSFMELGEVTPENYTRYPKEYAKKLKDDKALKKAIQLIDKGNIKDALEIIEKEMREFEFYKIINSNYKLLFDNKGKIIESRLQGIIKSLLLEKVTTTDQALLKNFAMNLIAMKKSYVDTLPKEILSKILQYGLPELNSLVLGRKYITKDTKGINRFIVRFNGLGKNNVTQITPQDILRIYNVVKESMNVNVAGSYELETAILESINTSILELQREVEAVISNDLEAVITELLKTTVERYGNKEFFILKKRIESPKGIILSNVIVRNNAEGENILREYIESKILAILEKSPIYKIDKTSSVLLQYINDDNIIYDNASKQYIITYGNKGYTPNELAKFISSKRKEMKKDDLDFNEKVSEFEEKTDLAAINLYLLLKVKRLSVLNNLYEYYKKINSISKLEGISGYLKYHLLYLSNRVAGQIKQLEEGNILPFVRRKDKLYEQVFIGILQIHLNRFDEMARELPIEFGGKFVEGYSNLDKKLNEYFEEYSKYLEIYPEATLKEFLEENNELFLLIKKFAYLETYRFISRNSDKTNLYSRTYHYNFKDYQLMIENQKGMNLYINYFNTWINSIKTDLIKINYLLAQINMKNINEHPAVVKDIRQQYYNYSGSPDIIGQYKRIKDVKKGKYIKVYYTRKIKDRPYVYSLNLYVDNITKNTITFKEHENSKTSTKITIEEFTKKFFAINEYGDTANGVVLEYQVVGIIENIEAFLKLNLPKPMYYPIHYLINMPKYLTNFTKAMIMGGLLSPLRGFKNWIGAEVQMASNFPINYIKNRLKVKEALQVDELFQLVLSILQLRPTSSKNLVSSSSVASFTDVAELISEGYENKVTIKEIIKAIYQKLYKEEYEINLDKIKDFKSLLEESKKIKQEMNKNYEKEREIGDEVETLLTEYYESMMRNAKGDIKKMEAHLSSLFKELESLDKDIIANYSRKDLIILLSKIIHGYVNQAWYYFFKAPEKAVRSASAYLHLKQANENLKMNKDEAIWYAVVGSELDNVKYNAGYRLLKSNTELGHILTGLTQYSIKHIARFIRLISQIKYQKKLYGYQALNPFKIKPLEKIEVIEDILDPTKKPRTVKYHSQSAAKTLANTILTNLLVAEVFSSLGFWGFYSILNPVLFGIVEIANLIFRSINDDNDDDPKLNDVLYAIPIIGLGMSIATNLVFQKGTFEERLLNILYTKQIKMIYEFLTKDEEITLSFKKILDYLQLGDRGTTIKLKGD